jgi:hypothetical protein
MESIKAMLLRVGIDKGTDGALAPIFADGSFEYIPISESDPLSMEKRTYKTVIGRRGKPLSTYLPDGIENRVLHFDPEFATFTYGDPTSKRNYLLKLNQNDLLVFYAGLTPFRTLRQKEGLYIIGFFTIEKVGDFNKLTKGEIAEWRKAYPNNAHIKRSDGTADLVITVGNRSKSRLLDEAIPISTVKSDKRARRYHVVSPRIEGLLGISGSIQRSIPPRFVVGNERIGNLKHLLSV